MKEDILVHWKLLKGLYATGTEETFVTAIDEKTYHSGKIIAVRPMTIRSVEQIAKDAAVTTLNMEAMVSVQSSIWNRL